MTKIMVYGTLKRGQRNNFYLKKAMYLGRARTVREDFIMVDMTGRFGYHFPGAVEAGGKWDAIEGEVYRVEPSLVKILDRHEGCDLDPRAVRSHGYYRRRLRVKLDDGTVTVAEVYLMSRERALSGLGEGGEVLPRGDWTNPFEKARHAGSRAA